MQSLDPALPILAVRGIQRGVLTMWRERGWTSAFGALFGVFLLVQLLLLIFLGMEGAQALLRSRTDLRLEINDGAADTDIQDFLSAVQAQPSVDEVFYITKEQAYERAKQRDPELTAFLEKFNLENPFPETIAVTLRSLDDYATFARFIELQRWQSVVDPRFLSEVTEQEANIYELLRVTDAARSLTLLLLGITAGTLVFITTELVRRRALARADEVLVERLVGAHRLSIVLPFATEAACLFWAAILASAAVLFGFIWLLPTLVPALDMGGALQALSSQILPVLATYLPLLLAAELLLAPILAGIGTGLGMRPQLRSQTLTVSL